MAMMLVISSLQKDEKQIRETLGKIDYHLKRNAAAYRSHSLKKERLRASG